MTYCALPKQRLPCQSIPLPLDDACCVEIACVQDARARAIKLVVTEAGARLTLPLGVSRQQGIAFVMQKKAWIHTQLSHYQLLPSDLPVDDAQCLALPLRDRRYKIRFSSARYLHIALCGDASVDIAIPPKATPLAVQHTLRQFYEAQARSDVAVWLQQYMPTFPTAPAKIRLSLVSSQWGSLTADGVLSLDLTLILAPPFVFEYVLVHELCHLLFPNHSRSFWLSVGQRFAHWKTAHRWLRLHGGPLKRQMRYWLCEQATMQKCVSRSRDYLLSSVRSAML